MQRISLTSNAILGVDAARRVPQELRHMGLRSGLVITDETVARVPHVMALLDAWAADGLSIVRRVLSRADAEPDYDYLDEVADRVRGVEADVVIGIGGGSALDLAKGIGVLLRNPGRGIDFRGIDRVQHPGIPVVLLPTTAGTGSEVTGTASFVDRSSRTKLGINGRHVRCALAILDPLLTVSCPPRVTGSSGLDALVHAVEAATCRTATDVSVMLGREAVRLLFGSLPQAVEAPDDLSARTDTLLGSHYAGLAMWNAGGGPASAVSYPLGVHHEVPHGLAGGVLLPHVVAANIKKGYTHGYARIYEALNNPGHGLSTDDDKAAAFCDWFFAIFSRLAVPRTLGEWGVTAATVAKLTDLTLAQRQTNLDLNPVPFAREDVEALIEAVAD